jgi:hypothetical protein
MPQFQGKYAGFEFTCRYGFDGKQVQWEADVTRDGVPMQSFQGNLTTNHPHEHALVAEALGQVVAIDIDSHKHNWGTYS